MDYAPYDSSGTDDDLPPSHRNRMLRGNRIAGNGRPAAIGSVLYSSAGIFGESDMEAQIHQLEQEAYSSVLRAFKAQADVITWEQESLITELRKELRLSNEEHRELLARVNEDDAIRRIREWRLTSGRQLGMHGAGQAVHDPAPSPSISASRKKQKIGSSLPSQSFSGPSSSFDPQAGVTTNQPSSSVAKRGPVLGPKGKKYKSNQILPGAPSMKMQYPSTGPTGRNHFSNRVSSGGLASEQAEPASAHSLIWRKVRTRWPDDNNFYEAVITGYNPTDGCHKLIYDMGRPNETSEWINLSEISPEDIQWEGEDPVISHYGAHGSCHGLNRPLGRDGGPGPGRGRGMTKGPPRKEFPSLQNGIRKKGADDIQLLHTDNLIKEVERVFSTSHPDPQEVEKAKKVLKEHEQALMDAITRLADMSDGESDGGGHFMHGQSMEVA